ncbi:MAG: hypothetical protein WB439_11165 [Acidobacteriaceae bacterium]
MTLSKKQSPIGNRAGGKSSGKSGAKAQRPKAAQAKTIRGLRILPPFAIGRLGSADEPLDNYTTVDDPKHPLNFRSIKAKESLRVDEATGVVHKRRPSAIAFKTGSKIRPVAPFLEVWAIMIDANGEETLEPLTPKLLASQRLGFKEITWRARVANRKVVRRTGDENDLVAADTGWFNDCKQPQVLRGRSKHFVSRDKFIEFGNVRCIKPSADFPGIRLRFTPAKGHIYGPAKEPGDRPDSVIPPERAVYDKTKGSWVGFGDPTRPPVANETLPPSLYAIEPPAPSWLNNNIAISRGYLDDSCDGFVEVRLKLPNGRSLKATARICAGPPALIPDALFVRTLADDLEQVLYGPKVSDDEPFEVTRERASDIIRRAYETVRFMNVALLNGNNYNGRSALSLDSMPEEEAADTERAIRPIMSPGTVDTLAILVLHEQVYASLRAGTAPWFVNLLRRPDQVADFTDRGRRKMPALMCGADNSYLALTWRQIDSIRTVAEQAMFHAAKDIKAPGPDLLTPLNLSAQLHYEAAGNPLSSRPVASVANCCPGLEVDFRAVWRRMFKGVVLREYDNLVVDIENPALRRLKNQRLMRVRLKRSDKRGYPMTTPIWGPAPSDPDGKILLTTPVNPNGRAPLEWSNALAYILSTQQGKTVFCDFTKDLTETQDQHEVCIDKPKNYVTVQLEVRHFFEKNSAVISPALADPGELTQGLCSPWQNDYRECSCYYWASARPDFINAEPAHNGLTKGDNWLQKKRTGNYVPDDYADSRLILYDELFDEWERWLRFQVGGKDLPDSKSKSSASKSEKMS